MFSKLSILLLVVPSIKALTLNTPSGLTSGGTATITWSNAAGDQSTFSLELTNQVFHNSFAIANNVDPANGTLTIQLPIVPVSDGYTIEAVDISNITNIFATTSSFSIGAASTTSSSSTSSSSSSATKLSTSATSTTSGATATPTTPVPSSSGSSPTSTHTSAAAPMKFGSAAPGIGAIAVALMTIVGGAAVLVL